MVTPVVVLHRTLQEKEKAKGLSRRQFFLIFLATSFAYYALPGYLFNTLTYFSWVCLAYPKTVTAQQLGSGFRGLGIGAISLDWASISSFLLSPLVTPFFTIVNVTVGFVLLIYAMVPIAYWKDWYNAKTFPIFSSKLFTSNGSIYPSSLRCALERYGKEQEQPCIHDLMFTHG